MLWRVKSNFSFLWSFRLYVVYHWGDQSKEKKKSIYDVLRKNEPTRGAGWRLKPFSMLVLMTLRFDSSRFAERKIIDDISKDN